MNGRCIHVIDTHTAGEPTRIVVDGGPDLGSGSLQERLQRLANNHDEFRSAVVNEPRGSNELVGALLCQPTDPRCLTGVIFFNNVGYLGMCGHGAMGVTVALAWRDKLPPDRYFLETPVGIVTVDFMGDNQVAVRNVPSYRHSHNVKIEVKNQGIVTGDVAWGGNWFFLTDDHGQELALNHASHLTEFAWNIRRTLTELGITGKDNAEIDHVELFGPPQNPRAHSRNFVLCPGQAYDRSPCGTGTSAKIACLIAAGKLQLKQIWIQESIVGSLFEAFAEKDSDGLILPTIRGSAFVIAEATLHFCDGDPFQMGIRP